MPQFTRPQLFTSNTSRPRTADDGKSLRPYLQHRPSTKRNVSFHTTVGAEPEPSLNVEQLVPEKPGKRPQIVDRHAQNVDPNIGPTAPSTAAPTTTPFVVYDDSMSALLGPNPTIKQVVNDPRAPFFYSGGAWASASSTLFLTSSLIRDFDPSAVAAAGKRTEVSKIEVYSEDHFSRDKVRFPNHNYLASGCAPYPSPHKQGVVLCVQGTLREPAGLVYVDAKRPHKSHVILNNFQGRPFNSPCDIVANFYDNCLYFTDPSYGYERGYRPKPELPTGHIYRFDPSTGDCRVVVDRLGRPGGLAFSPDFAVLYVSDLGDKYGGTTIHALDMLYVNHGPALSGLPANGNRPDTVNGHQKNPSASSTTSSIDSATSAHREPPTASAGALAAANGQAMRHTPTPTTNGNSVGCIARSNSRDRARRFFDMAHPSPKPLKSVSSSLAMNLKSSFNATPALNLAAAAPPHHSTLNYSHHQPVRPSSPSLTISSLAPYNTPAANSGTRRSAFATNKRLFAYSTAFALSGGISTDPAQGNLWLGTEDGVEIYGGIMGSLVGKLLVAAEDESDSSSSPSSSSPIMPGPSATAEGGARKPERRKMRGVSKVAFTDPGEAWLLGGERMWRIRFGA